MLEKNLFSAGFTDNKRKIVPSLTDDWTIASSYKNNCIQVRSILLNISFDVSTSDFISDCLTHDISIKGNKIDGMYIFDTYRNLRTQEEFYQWEDEKEQNKVDQIKKSDLIIGHQYILEDGSKGFYLGAKYISRITTKVIALENIGKISKKHIFYYLKSFAYGKTIGFLSEKVIGLGDSDPIDRKSIETKLDNFNKSNPTFCYFEDYITPDPIYKRKEVSNEYEPLSIQIGNEEYISRYMDKQVKSSKQGSLSSSNKLHSSFILINNQHQRYSPSVHNGTANKRFRYLVA